MKDGVAIFIGKHHWFAIILILMLVSCTGVQTSPVSPISSIETNTPAVNPTSPTPITTEPVTPKQVTTVTFTSTNIPKITTAPTKAIAATETTAVFPAPPILPSLSNSPDGKCPVTKADLKLSLPELVTNDMGLFDPSKYPLPKALLVALNQGASIATFKEALNHISVTYLGSKIEGIQVDVLKSQDVTGDGVPEMLIFTQDRNLIYACHSGQYQLIFDQYRFDPEMPMLQPIIRDINRDNIPEAIIGYNNNVSVVGGLAVSILGWRGNRFQTLITKKATEPQWDTILDQPLEGYFYISGYSKVEINDVNGDGKEELVLPIEQGNSDLLFHGPIRNRTDFLAWHNGEFVPLMSRYDPPTYRFQAVEDGDWAFQAGDFSLALKFYRQAIEDQNLEWWSQERYLHLQAEFEAEWQKQSSPTPIPPDSTEYPRLAAYANYRIILTYLAQGQISYAEQAYGDFQSSFPKDKPGHIYAEMGKTFWEAYQSTGNLGEGCHQANSYLEKHQDEILGVLDYNWHGWQSIEYQPEIVCPFK